MWTDLPGQSFATSQNDGYAIPSSSRPILRSCRKRLERSSLGLGGRSTMDSLRMLRSVAVVIGLAAPALPAAAEPFTGVYAFGDSLSDAGNVFIATGGAIPGAPYFAGHFSNGPTW